MRLLVYLEVLLSRFRQDRDFQEQKSMETGNLAVIAGPRPVLLQYSTPGSVEEVQRVARIIHIIDAPADSDQTEQRARAGRIARAVEQVF